MEKMLTPLEIKEAWISNRISYMSRRNLDLSANERAVLHMTLRKDSYTCIAKCNDGYIYTINVS